MRITEIEIKNFRAFYGSYQINLHKAGKNLLVYGENGSGKSSLSLALKLFLESAVKDHRFEEHRNIFIKDEDSGYIKLYIRANQYSKQSVYKWSKTVKETSDIIIAEASKTKGFLGYKELLETHYIQRKEETVNIFDLLVNNLLANTINNVTNRSFSDDWADVAQAIPRRNTGRRIEVLEERMRNFNTGLSDKLVELKDKASEIFGRFGYDIFLDFNFNGLAYNRHNKTIDNQHVFLTVRFFGKDLSSHHRFLNEAKLSAIAVAISFSSFLLQPESSLKIIALDDVLIGLDMSNRLPVIDVLKEYFSEYQIFLMTYDRAWYEIVKQHTPDSEWKYAEFYFSKTDEYEIPVYLEDRSYLEKAKEYLVANDYKACAIYLRTAFEMAIKKFCDKKNLKVRYCENPKHLITEDFWVSIKAGNFLQQTLITEIELYRSIILNPLSHAAIVNIPRGEIENAMKAVEDLDSCLLNLG